MVTDRTTSGEEQVEAVVGAEAIEKTMQRQTMVETLETKDLLILMEEASETSRRSPVQAEEEVEAEESLQRIQTR